MRGYTLLPTILMALLPGLPGPASSADIRLILVPGSALRDRQAVLRQVASLRQTDNGTASVVICHGPLMTLENGWGGSDAFGEVLDDLGCVAVVPTGMDWGREPGLLPRLAEGLRQAVVAANAAPGESADRWPAKIVKICVITAGGSRVTICGLVNRTAGLWQLPECSLPVRFQDEDLALLDIAQPVQRTSSQIALLFVEKDLRWSGGPYGGLDSLVGMFPYFDLVVGTHGWRALGLRRLGDSLFLQPGRNRILVVDIGVTEAGDARGGPDLSVRTEEIQLPEDSDSDTTAALRSFMQRMMEAAGADVAWYPDAKELYAARAGREPWMVDGSRICVMRIPYSRLRRLVRKWNRGKGLLWCSNGMRDLDSFSRRPKGYRSRVHPRRKIRVCLTTRLAASFGGRFRFLRELAEDPRSELEVLQISAADLFFEKSCNVRGTITE